MHCPKARPLSSEEGFFQQIGDISGVVMKRAPACLYSIRERKMLWTIAVILFLLWALGLTTAYASSGLIHILLVLAIVVVIIRVLQGRRAI